MTRERALAQSQGHLAHARMYAQRQLAAVFRGDAVEARRAGELALRAALALFRNAIER